MHLTSFSYSQLDLLNVEGTYIKSYLWLLYPQSNNCSINYKIPNRNFDKSYLSFIYKDSNSSNSSGRWVLFLNIRLRGMPFKVSCYEEVKKKYEYEFCILLLHIGLNYVYFLDLVSLDRHRVGILF